MTISRVFSSSEFMLLIGENVLMVKIFHKLAVYDVFDDLSAY